MTMQKTVLCPYGCGKEITAHHIQRHKRVCKNKPVPSLTPTVVLAKDEVNSEQAGVEVADANMRKRARYFIHFVRAQPADSPAGAIARCIYQGHLFAHHVDTTRNGSGSVKRWKAALLELQAMDGLAANVRHDVDQAVAGFEEVVGEWRIEQAAFETLTGGRTTMTKVGDYRGPVAEAPVMAIKCVYPSCGKWAVYGGMRCEDHGGQWMAPELRQAMLMAAFEKLVDASETAVTTLVDVMLTSRRDDARVAAAREVLDRVGIRPGNEVNIHVHNDGEVTLTALENIRERLDNMAMATARQAEFAEAYSPPVLDIEEADTEEVQVG